MLDYLYGGKTFSCLSSWNFLFWHLKPWPSVALSKTSRIISSLYIFQVSVRNLKTTLNSPESSSVKLAQMQFSELLCCVPKLYAMSHSHLDDAPLDLQRSFCRPRLPFFWTGFLYIVMNFIFFVIMAPIYQVLIVNNILVM